MNLVPAAISTRLSRNALLLQKASPNLLFGVGIVGVAAGTVLACRATLKIDSVLDEAEKKVHQAKEANLSGYVNYSDKDLVHDMRIIKFQTGVHIVKLYTPAIIVTGIGIASLTSSHRILTNRNAALTAAYATLDEAFTRYRARVIKKYGKDQDRDFYYETEQVEITKGKGKKEVTRIAPGGVSGYARFFDQHMSQSWSKDPETNFLFLKCQQNFLNDRLHVKGHVFLNEAYDSLGLPRTKEGAVVGWILSKDGSTDNYISFGVFEGQTQNTRDFVNGREGAVLCDFNVDGVIYDKIEKVREELEWQLEN